MLNVDEPDYDAYDCYDFCKHVTKVIQLLLQRCGVGNLRRDALMYVTNCSRASRKHHYCHCVASCNSGSGEEHIGLILLYSLRIVDGVAVLADTFAFTSQYSLIYCEIIALDRQQSAVGRYAVANCDGDNISRYKPIGLYPLHASVSNDFGLICGIFLQRSNSHLSAAFL